jgi:thioredoxin reductase
MTSHNALLETFDVAVIGGGAAGLSAALMLARSRRAVVVIDAGSPRNAPAAGVHGFLTRDGMSPLELLALGRAEVEHYGGTIAHAEVTASRRLGDRFELTLATGDTVTARRLIVATGLVDELPDVPGVRERWGHDVIHCPYCHGWEFRDQPIGILATSERALHQTFLFRQLTSDLVLFTHTAPEFTEVQVEQLEACAIRIVHGIVDGLEISNDRIVGVRLQGGEVVPRNAVVVGPRFVARSAVLFELGLRPSAHPLGDFISANATGQTDIPGVWVAGNVTDLAAQVVGAAASGAMVGAQVNADLAMEDTRLAVTANRKQTVSAS